MRNLYKEGDILTKVDFDTLKQEVNNKFKIGNFEKGKKVYIDSNISISRKDFKENYPTNEIVKSLKEADIYISKTKPSCYVYFGSNNTIVLTHSTHSISQLNKLVEFVNQKLTIVNPKSIIFKSCNEELPLEMEERIQKMLQSPDKETFNLGWKILFEYDYIKSMDRFFLLIGRANKISYYKRRKGRTIEQKLNHIKEQFPNCKF